MVSPDGLTPIERVLEQQGRTRAWLARETGISVSYAWRMIKGELPTTPEFRAKAVKALGIPEDFLFPAVTTEQAS